MIRSLQVDTSTVSCFRLAWRWQRALLVGVLGAAMSLGAVADEVLRGGQWLSTVSVLGVADSTLIYSTAGVRRSIPLEDIQSLKLDSDSGFNEAVAAFNDGQMRQAQRAFIAIAEETSAPWVRDYCNYYLVQIFDQRGEPTDAAESYIALALNEADLFFMSRPPYASLAEASDNQTYRILEEVTAGIDEAQGDHRKLLSAFSRVITGEAEAPADGTPGNPLEVLRPQHPDSVVILPARVWEVLEQDDAENDWAALLLLSEGKYQETIDTIEPWLSNPRDLTEKLFILGRAQLALADQENDRGMYLDAGLTFMRIVIHFKQLDDPLIAPAKLEVAYIHQQIGRDDLYQSLLFDSSLSLSFAGDSQTYPEYYLRYYEIIGEDPPDPNAVSEDTPEAAPDAE